MCLQTDQKDALKMEERGLKWRECGQHMEAQKGKGKDSLVETAGGNTGPLTPDFQSSAACVVLSVCHTVG